MTTGTFSEAYSCAAFRQGAIRRSGDSRFWLRRVLWAFKGLLNGSWRARSQTWPDPAQGGVNTGCIFPTLTGVSMGREAQIQAVETLT
jgi:hypothetical protein